MGDAKENPQQFINLNKKIAKAYSDIVSMEGRVTDVIKKGSKEPAHFLDMSYYSGVHNGFQFFRYIMDNQDITEKEFDELFKSMMHFNKLNVN